MSKFGLIIEIQSVKPERFVYQ